MQNIRYEIEIYDGEYLDHIINYEFFENDKGFIDYAFKGISTLISNYEQAASWLMKSITALNYTNMDDFIHKANVMVKQLFTIDNYVVHTKHYQVYKDGERLVRLNNKEWDDLSEWFNLHFLYDEKGETWFLNAVSFQGEYFPESNEYIDLFTFIINNIMDYTNKDFKEYLTMIMNHIRYYVKGEWEIMENE